MHPLNSLHGSPNLKRPLRIRNLHGITHGCSTIEATKLASIAAGLQAQGIGAIKSIPYHDDVYSVFKGA